MYRRDRLFNIKECIVGVAAVLLLLLSPLAAIGTANADSINPEMASVTSDGTPGDRGSFNAQMSKDGRYVAFESISYNLGSTRAGIPEQAPFAVYIHDRTTGSTTIQSVNSDEEQENGNLGGYRLSGNGKFITFATDASNMGNGTGGTGWRTYLRDIDAGTTTLLANFTGSGFGVMSDDANVIVDSQGIKNRTTGEIYSVPGYVMHITGDGRYVGYDSSGLKPQAHRYDLETGEDILVGSSPDGTTANQSTGVVGMSDDGTKVLMNTTATNLIPDGRRMSAGRLILKDLATNTLQRIDVRSDGSEAPNIDQYATAAANLTSDGNVAYFSSSLRLTDDNFVNYGYSVYARDLTTGTTRVISLNSWGVPTDSESYYQSMNHDGSILAFESNASNLGLSEHYFSQIFVEPTVAYTGPTDTVAPTINSLNWGVNPVARTATTSFTINATDDAAGISRGEFWVDDQDSGVSYDIPLAYGDGTTLTGTTPQLEPGVHTIHVRVMDKANNWSQITTDYLVVYDSGKTKMRGQGAIVPTYGTDTLPGLIQNGQTDKGKFGMLVVYKNGNVDTTKSALTFSYKTGVRCAKPTAYNCHDLNLTSTGVNWLVLDQENKSHGTADATATLTVDGVTTTNPIRVDGIDGSRLAIPGTDHYLIKIYATGANPNTAQPIYQASGALVKGNVRIVAPTVVTPPPQL
jgi:hypothetical protein